MKRYTLLLLFCLAGSIGFAQKKAEFTVAFGSCNRQDLPQPLWDVIIKDKPDLWIWLGDNIYGDSNDTTVLRTKYNLLLNNPGYKRFSSKIPVIGTWDDHDYGRNDGNKTYPSKKESQKLALDFLKEPANSPRRKQEGIYISYNYQIGKSKLKVILLDVRYHQDTLSRTKKGYIPNPTGDILGEEQWKWLEKELKNSDADVHLIGSGLQIIPEQHATEKWGNFPSSVKRLNDLLVSSKAKGVILITGDRHIGEISKKDIPGMKYPLYEITSSGLTHSYINSKNVNLYRIGKLVTEKNYGIFHFTGYKKRLELVASIKGENGIFTEETIKIR